MENVKYKAPRWACLMWKHYKEELESYGQFHDRPYSLFHNGRIVLEEVFDCSFYDSTGFFHSELQPIESDTFEAVTVKPTPTHAVFNSDREHYSLESGRLYPITDWTGSSFYLVKPDGSTLFCLVDNCAHIEPAQWTLVHVVDCYAI